MTTQEALDLLYRKACTGVWERSGSIRRDLARVRMARMTLNRKLRQCDLQTALSTVGSNDKDWEKLLD